jgi:hypothetical protein
MVAITGSINKRGHCLTIDDGILIPETLLKGFVPCALCSVLRALCFISAVARRRA